MQLKADTPTVLAFDLSVGGLHLGVYFSENPEKSMHFSDPKPYSGARIIGVLEQFLTDHNLDLTDIDLLVVTSGPGSFTGLRVTLAAAESLAFNRNLPIVGVPTLTAMAASNADNQQPVQVLLPASGKDTYVQTFNTDLTPATNAECLSKDSLAPFDGQIIQAPQQTINPITLAELGWRELQQNSAPKRVQLQYVKALSYKKVNEQGKAA